MDMPISTEIYTRKPTFDIDGIKKPEDITIKNRFDHKRTVFDGYYRNWNDSRMIYGKDSLMTCLSHSIQLLLGCKRDDTGKYIVDGVLEDLKIDFDNIVKVLTDNRSLLGELNLYNYMIRYPGNIDEGEEVIPEGYSVIIDICYALLFAGKYETYDTVCSFVDRISKIPCAERNLQQGFINEILYAVSRVGDYYLLAEGDLNVAIYYYAMVEKFAHWDNSPNLTVEMGDKTILLEGYEKIIDVLKVSIDSYNIWFKVAISISNKNSKFVKKDTDLALLLEGKISSKYYQIIWKYMDKNKTLINVVDDEKPCMYEDIGGELWNITNEYFRYLLESGKEEMNALRNELLIYYTLLRDSLKYGVLQIDGIAVDIKQVAGIYSELDCFIPLSLYEYDTIEDYIKYECDNNIELFESLFYISIYVDHLRHILGLPPMPDRLGYYTTLSTLEYLLPISANVPNYAMEKMSDDGLITSIANTNSISNMVGRYSVMNVGHMNDPQEGKILLYKLLGDQYQPDNRLGLHNQYVFLKSFTTRIDDLPMWEMYGGHAKGCCIELDMERIKEEGDYNLARVCYLRKNNDEWDILEKDNEELKGYIDTIKDYLGRLSDICDKIINPDDSNNLDRVIKLLNPILYLFKASTYSHENEYRIIESTKVDDARICYTKERDGGRLYIPSKQRAYIKEIILGPKFEYVEDTLPYLQYRCHYLKDELKLTNEIVIKVSEHEYI